jgi:hypothetical protein
MFQGRLVFAVIGLWAIIGLAGCGGAGMSNQSPAAITVPAARQESATNGPLTQSAAVRVGPVATTSALALTAGLSGSITLHSASPNTTVQIGTGQPAVSSRETTLSGRGCPAIPPIVIFNPYAHPITIAIDAFTVQLPCSVNGLLFGASAYQSHPIPQTLVSTKLGDAAGSGHTITFTPTVSQLTLPANSALTISILPETSTAFTQLPAVANTMTSLTSNAPAVPNSLSLEAPSVQGGTTFQSACYLPNDPNGPGLGVNILGTVSFYCVLVPGQTGTSTTFGSRSTDIVKFTLGPNVKPDVSFVGLDGPPIFAPCTPVSGGAVCNSPPFAIPVYSKAYVGNVADIAACVPATKNTDCNGAGNYKAPSAASVPPYKEFQLLFADDPSYNAAKTFGGVTLQIDARSPCAIDTGSDANDANGDAPNGYTDASAGSGAPKLLTDFDFKGVGPNVEFDIHAEAPGRCTVNLTEDSGLKRTFAFQITVRSK